MISTNTPAQQWQQIIVAVQKELSSLGAAERLWIEQHLDNIHDLQRQLHQLFIAGDGPNQCRKCLGSCCECGNNHMTLANVLSGLLNDNLPAANFTNICPFLNEQGCMLAVQTRPFNCVTFICERIDDNLSSVQRAQFYALEKLLREQYLAFDQRYMGSSLCGILIRSQSMSGGRFLALNA
jgi:hypothetical protein